jgi:RNA polymerase sigma factor (sigma-70 family)
MMSEDEQLLGQYTRDRSEAAFGEIVRRHIDLVFSAALRVVGGDSHLAQDVTQIVFTDLARKAWGLPAGVVLPGWLHRHTCFTAAKAVRTERRRQAREKTAMEMNTLDDHTGPDWESLAPHLDEGLNELSAADRDAIVLRFLRQQDFRSVGAALGVSEDTAQKRVSRALEKLRGVLSRRGIALSSAAIGSLMAAEAVKAAPIGLAVSVTTTSLAAATTAGTGISLALMKVMAMTKLQITLAGAVLVAAVATPLVLQQQTLNRMRTETAQLRQENESLQSQSVQIAALIAENQRLSNQVAQVAVAATPRPEATSEVLRLRNQVTRLQTDAQTKPKSSNSMADMLKSPEMKEMMKSTFALMTEKTYAKFFATANLSAEQTTALKDLLVNRDLAGMDAGLSAMSGENDPAKRQEQAEQVKNATAAIDEQIKQLLGPETYTRFQDYDKTQSERVTIASFKDGSPAGETLNATQEEQLVAAMKEERENFKFAIDMKAQGRATGDYASAFTPEKMQQYSQELDRLNQRYLARAKDILSPEQLDAFGKFLTKQQQAGFASMQMGAKLLSPPK